MPLGTGAKTCASLAFDEDFKASNFEAISSQFFHDLISLEMDSNLLSIEVSMPDDAS